MIEGVTFDWWNTIAVATTAQDKDLRALRIARMRPILTNAAPRRAIPEAELFVAYDRQTELLADAWARNVDLSPEEQIRAFLRFAGLDGVDVSPTGPLADAYAGALLELPPSLYPNILETLEWLEREGYAVGLVSNTGRTWGRFLRQVQDGLGLGRYLDARVFSDEVGIRKPDRRIFEVATRELGLPPDRVVHVGDDATADIVGAKGSGMRAVWFNTGFWKGAKAEDADEEIHDHSELPALLRRWRT